MKCQHTVTSGATCGVLVGIAAAEIVRPADSAVAYCTALVVTSFFFGFVNKNILWRKLALVMNAVVILTFFNSTSPSATNLLQPLFIGLLCAVLGVATGLFAMLLPYPIIASGVQSRILKKRNAQAFAGLYRVLLRLYCTPPEKDLKRLHYQVKADMLFRVIQENLAATKRVCLYEWICVLCINGARSGCMIWMPLVQLNMKMFIQAYEEETWEKVFRKNDNYVKYIASLVRMQESLEAMQRTLKMANYNSPSYIMFCKYMRSGLLEMGRAMGKYLKHISNRRMYDCVMYTLIAIHFIKPPYYLPYTIKHLE